MNSSHLIDSDMNSLSKVNDSPSIISSVASLTTYQIQKPLQNGPNNSGPTTNAKEEILRGLVEQLHKTIRGQEHIIPKIVSVLERGELGLTPSNRPKGSFLFVGATGVGKTETALTFTEHLFGPGSLHRFDMSEFQHQPSISLLLGANPNESGLLGNAIDSLPNGGTLLFDEIEKAHPLILDLFLQILDAARITPADGRTRDLSKFYVVLTSNIGAAYAMRIQLSGISAIERTVLAHVQQNLRPELVARITEKIVFARLTHEHVREICQTLLNKELTRLAKLGYKLTASPNAVEWLIRKGFDSKYGARPLRDTIERSVQNTLAKSILNKQLTSGVLTVSKDHSSLIVTDLLI